MAQYKGASTDGFRAKTLLKKREKQKEEIEHMKMKITEVNFAILHKFLAKIFCVFTVSRNGYPTFSPKHLEFPQSSTLSLEDSCLFLIIFLERVI